MDRVRQEIWESNERRMAHKAALHTEDTAILKDPPEDLFKDFFMAGADDDPKTYKQTIQCEDATTWD